MISSSADGAHIGEPVVDHVILVGARLHVERRLGEELVIGNRDHIDLGAGRRLEIRRELAPGDDMRLDDQQVEALARILGIAEARARQQACRRQAETGTRRARKAASAASHHSDPRSHSCASHPRLAESPSNRSAFKVRGARRTTQKFLPFRPRKLGRGNANGGEEIFLWARCSAETQRLLSGGDADAIVLRRVDAAAEHVAVMALQRIVAAEAVIAAELQRDLDRGDRIVDHGRFDQAALGDLGNTSRIDIATARRRAAAR